MSNIHKSLLSFLILVTIPLSIIFLNHCAFQPPAKAKHSFIAYSLREAAVQARSGRLTSELIKLGGITRIAGIVYDRKGKDIILVGLSVPELPSAHLDDLVVALRARLIHDEWPLVSIDPVADTEKTKLQKVRFDGHIEDSDFGRDFLDCDILLKQYSLQLVKTINAVHAYNVLLEDDIKRTAKDDGVIINQVQWLPGDDGIKLCQDQQGTPLTSEKSYQARFWFYVLEPYIYAQKEDVFCIKELRLALKSESIFQDESKSSHLARNRFAEEWTEHFNEIYQAYPVLKRLKVLYDLISVAEAIRKIENLPDIGFLLYKYHIPKVKTDPSYKLEELYGIVERSDGFRHLVRISGGIELKSQIKFLNYGDVTPLRSIVINSRPSPNALTWRPPLEGWKMPNAKGLECLKIDDDQDSVRSVTKPGYTSGCSILYQSVILDPQKHLKDSSDIKKSFSGFPPPPPPPPPLRGVSMHMVVSDESFTPDTSGKLDEYKENLLKARPSSGTLSWPVSKTKEKNK